MTGEFANLRRQGYPVNELLRMAGADYDVRVECGTCGGPAWANTGDDPDRFIECDDCCSARVAAAKPVIPATTLDDLPF